MLFTYKKYFSFGSRLHNFFRLLLCHSLVQQQFYSAKSTRSVLKTATFSLGILFSTTYLTSCEKVIDIDLNDAEKKYVVEAVITDQPNSCKVILTETKNFDENNTFDAVRGAQVTIADNNASPVTLVETSAGVYEAAGLTGISGHTYNLKINVGGKAFNATSTMPSLVPLDSLYITERTFFDETHKYAILSFLDPPGKGNAYRHIQYVNGVKEKTIFVRDDDFSDGLAVERTLIYFYDDDEAEKKEIKTGDKVQIEMLCISYPVYKYWYSLAESSTGENQSASPGNPLTNIEGGALGYFSAHTIQTKAITVP